MQIPRKLLSNNMQLEDVTRSSIFNNFTSYSDRLRAQLNDGARQGQIIQLEEKYLHLTARFETAPDLVRARILNDLDNGIQRVEQEEYNLAFIQDPAPLRGRRKHRKGGKRIPTGAELADKELRQNEQSARKEMRKLTNSVNWRSSRQDSHNLDEQNANQLSVSHVYPGITNPVVSNHIPNLNQAPVIMTSTSSGAGAVVRSPQRSQHLTNMLAQSPQRSQVPTTAHTRVTSESLSPLPVLPTTSITGASLIPVLGSNNLSTSPSRLYLNALLRPRRQVKRRILYEGGLETSELSKPKRARK